MKPALLSAVLLAVLLATTAAPAQDAKVITVTDEASPTPGMAVVSDYHGPLPPDNPRNRDIPQMPGWPKILPAAARLGRFVYGGAHDWMWAVSSHMSIGRVHKQGKWHDMWFILTREDSR